MTIGNFSKFGVRGAFECRKGSERSQVLGLFRAEPRHAGAVKCSPLITVITIRPIRITQLIPREFSGVTEVKLIMPINLTIFWCNRWCAPS